MESAGDGGFLVQRFLLLLMFLREFLGEEFLRCLFGAFILDRPCLPKFILHGIKQQTRSDFCGLAAR